MNENVGTISMGIRCPIIRKGDDLKQIVVDAVLEATDGKLEDRDVIGITESVVARAQGNYCSVDQIVKSIDKITRGKKTIILNDPIMSRNRFSVILRAFARYADRLYICSPNKYDCQGNPTLGVNQFTGVDMREYYRSICEEENCDVVFCAHAHEGDAVVIDASCHPDIHNTKSISLRNVMQESIGCSGYNYIWGVLGSNKVDDETLKLFPSPNLSKYLVMDIQEELKNRTGKTVEVMVYGDGCFKDPIGGIWEFADPEVSPAYTDGLKGTPNEIKIKAFADDKYKDYSGDELTNAIKSEVANKDNNLVGDMASQGTTPRRYVDLLGSLMDLTSGSGDKGTPIVLVRGYFKNYAN